MRVQTYMLLIITIGFLLYVSIVQNGFIGDDFSQIVNNTQVHSLANFPHFFFGSTYASGRNELVGIFYRPIMVTLYAFIYALFGAKPGMFHLMQFLLHISNAILLFLFFGRFFRKSIAFFCSVAFLVAPVNNESVVYIANLQEPLFFFFGMLALLVYTKANHTFIRTITIGLLFLCGLFAKETAILFIIMFLVQVTREDKQTLRTYGTLAGLVTLVYLIFREGLAKISLGTTTIVTPIFNLPLQQRMLAIPLIIVYYLQRFFLPYNQPTEQFWIVTHVTAANFYIPLIILLLLFFIQSLGYIFIKTYRKYDTNAYLFFWIWTWIGFLPHIQIIPLDATVADRWFYFSSAGFAGMIGIVIKQIPLSTRWHKYAAITIAAVIILFLSFQTFMRNFDWRDEMTLYGKEISEGGHNFIVYNAYGTALINSGEYEKAKPFIFASVKEHAYYANLNNLAIIYTYEKHISLAKKYLQQALQKSTSYVLYENYARFLLAYDTPNNTIFFTSYAIQQFPQDNILKTVLRQAKKKAGKNT